MSASRRLAELPALIGEELGVSRWRTVTQDDIDAFADLTGDHQWIHVDREAATAGPFGAPIAHGYLTLSLIGGFWAEAFDVADAPLKVNYGMDRMRFVSPVRAGSRVRMRSRLERLEPLADGWRLVVDQTIELEGSDRPALVARCLYDFRRPVGADMVE
jgi:acyl dehydratase